MGYRSEVLLGVETANVDGFNKMIKDNKIEWISIEKELNDYTIYYADDLKWSSRFADVKLVKDFIHDQDEGWMIANGEDGALHEEHGDWDQYVFHSSQIGVY